MTRKTEYYYALDGIRFAAALSVCLFHLGFYSWASEGSTTARMLADAGAFPFMTPWTWAGWMGVEIFFVLSGFVIAHSANGATPLAFLKSRMLRLLPAAWICATLTLLAVLVIARRPLGEAAFPYLRAVMLWPEGPWIDGVYWSLGVEVVFYAIIFAMLMLRRFWMLPHLAWALVAASGAFLTIMQLKAIGVVADSRLLQFITAHSESLLLRHGVFFASGMWLWLASRRQMTPLRWVGLSIAIMLGGLEIWLRADALQHLEATAAQGQPIVALVVVWLVFIAAMLAITRWPSAFAPSSPLVRDGLKSLGRATYPLYLVHNVVGAGIARELLLLGVTPYGALAAAIASVITLALLVAAVPEVVVRQALRWCIEQIERFEIALDKIGLRAPSDPI